MSYTTVKAIWPGEKTEDLEELRNSHGSAPVIWNEIAKKYLGCGDFEYGLDRNLNLLWPLYKHLGIPKHQRAVLLMTYDRAFILKKDYARAAADIRAWLKDFPPLEGYANHWPKVAEIFESDPESPAIGLHCTSVSEDPFQGDWNEDKEDYEPVDWTTCFNVYEELENVCKRAMTTPTITPITAAPDPQP